MTLTTWRRLSNAKQFFDLGCEPRGSNRPKKVTLAGADQACANAGDTGICFDKPTGSVCLWEVRVEFRRGNVTGEVGTVATKGYSVNSIPHTTRLARAALARWH